MKDNIGYVLFIDEAGDEGIERVSPIHPNGASEYFVLAGVIVRASRLLEVRSTLLRIKSAVGLEAGAELHFRDLSYENQLVAIRELGNFKAGFFCVASNKRNMIGYRNRRVEASILETKRNGRVGPQKYNWFYNNTVRYLLESASKECARWSPSDRLQRPKIDIVFSLRKEFSYAQTSAYLEQMRVRGARRFNNLDEIDWSVVSPYLVRAEKGKNEDGLQLADCVVSAVYRALDEDHFGTTVPEFLEVMAPKFLRKVGAGSPKGHGFKLLPLGFEAPLSDAQRRALAAVSYTF
jgi:hypothetical protein